MSEAGCRVLDLRRRHEYSAALELARAAAAEEPEPALLVEAGRLEDEAGNHAESAAAFEQALAVSDAALRPSRLNVNGHRNLLV